MKLTVNRFFLLSLLLVSITRGDEAGSTLSFSDKTTITGSPQSANGKDKSIKLTSPSLEGEVTLKTHELLELTLDGKPPAVKSDHYALATITPRYDKSPPLDTIRGRLLHLDEKTVTLETSYAGELTLNRLMVKALDIYSQSPSFYNGPNGPDGWVTSGGKVEDSWTLVVQVNGKKRGDFAVPASLDPKQAKDQIIALAQADESVIRFVGDKVPKRVIYVPGRLINFVL